MGTPDAQILPAIMAEIEFYDSNKNALGPFDSIDPDEGMKGDRSSSDAVKPRILSTVGSITFAPPDGSTDGFSAKVDIIMKPEAKERNKRLFGALMGHLGTAKRKLEEDSSTIDKQSSRQSAVSQKNVSENKRLQQLERVANDTLKAKERALRETFQLRQRKVEIAAASEAWRDKCIAPLTRVLFTVSSPHICWLPSVHNDRTKKMLEERAAQIAIEVSNREESDAEALQQIESQLLDLQPLIAADSFSSEVNSVNYERIGTNDNNSEIVSNAATAQMSKSELAEYVLRVRSRKKPTPLDDRERDLHSANGNSRRTNWLLDDDSGGTDREGGMNGFTSNNAQKSQSISQNGQCNQMNVNRGRDRRNTSDADAGQILDVDDKEDGEDGEEVAQQRERTHSTDNSSGAPLEEHESDKLIPEPSSFNGEDLDGDGVDDADGDEEEDEAELLLAALGGRCH